MNIEEFREYCLSKAGVTEEFPFDEKTLVYKVMGKMFTATDIDMFNSINLKCLPEKAIELREQYAEIKPGYHMNKKHWNTIEMKGSLQYEFITKMIDESYSLVSKGLTKAKKLELKNYEK